ncbi:MAG: hypothetical protein KC518_10030 [Candidatus Cloacimonetes bacterium]|nr:hypothetical protein [Candidatus Cloacimonadota bacterium]
MKPRTVLVRLSICLCAAASLQAQPEYSVTDITNWTQGQLDGLPFFKDYVPYPPLGATGGFERGGRNSTTVFGGYAYGNTWVQHQGALITGGVQTLIAPLGTFNWQYTYWDGTDYHFSNGWVGVQRLEDINASGIAVGTSTVTGSGTHSYEASYHAVRFDPLNGVLEDLTPDASQANARAINDDGEIVGSINSGSGTQGFRRSSSGAMTLLGTTSQAANPVALNSSGWILGQYTVYPNKYAFISARGQGLIDLGLPSQNSPESAQPNSLNDWGQAVGTTWKLSDVLDRNGCLWLRNTSGNWEAHDLNELSGGGDYIIESGLAINDAGYIIASGRLDGTDLFGSRTLLLTPDSFNPPIPQPAPVELAIDRQPDGSFLLTWSDAGAGFTYTVESCTDLLSDTWAPLESGSWPISTLSHTFDPAPLPDRLLLRVIPRFMEQ